MAAITITKVLTTTTPTSTRWAPGRRLSGVVLVPADMCQYGEAIGAGDVLCVDFDLKHVTKDGLYLLESVGTEGMEWMGCRRFTRGIDGALSVDDSGRGDWREVGAGNAGGLRVVGRVERVYRAV